MSEIAVDSEVAGLRIDALAGRGGSSVVYRATDLQTGEPRAAKVLTTGGEAAARRMQREAELLASIDHPAIVPFRRLYQSEQQTILITDWVAGRSLLERLQDHGPISSDEALQLLAALADPLDHLHAQGIVHRDISPANIIIGPDGSLTVIDLGIGHLVDASTLTNHDLLAGTPKYLAPEVIRGETAAAPSDQYSVAVMIHELMTGESPFPRSEQIATALHHQLNSAPVALDEIDPSIPSSLADAILRAMCKDPEQRFGSMAEMARAAASTAPEASGKPGRRRNLLLAGAVGSALTVALVAWQLSPTETPVETAEPQAADSTATAELESDPESESSSTADSDSTVLDLSTDVGQVIEETGWSPGMAEALDCNLLTGHGFENGSVPTDYYGNPPGRERVVDVGGYGDSWALEVGLVGDYGQYGEIIDIEAGQGYIFRGWFDLLPPVADVQMGIHFLDEAYDPMPGTTTTLSIVDLQAGFREVTVAAAPPGAARAVPYLYKDSSQGLLLADELVFGPSGACAAEFDALSP
ncbi:MAG: serine/threonine protein kinase [Acidimicrobiales bacterium]